MTRHGHRLGVGDSARNGTGQCGGRGTWRYNTPVGVVNVRERVREVAREAIQSDTLNDLQARRSDGADEVTCSQLTVST